ncbi:uncharacterized protein [Drosophila takahashii]|uniref:uncharacterized protein n=1 Tax=Drosophila takahashii TaxID=29030 RepID=UPI0038996389
MPGSSGSVLKRTRTVWTPEMEVALVDLWGDHIEDIRGPRKNSHVYQMMSMTMGEQDIDVSWTEVRTKLENLTRKYKKEKEMFDKVDRILGSFAVHNMESRMVLTTRLQSFCHETEEDIIELDPSEMAIPEPRSSGAEPPRKRGKLATHQELIDLARERNDIQREQQQQTREHQREEILRGMAEQNAAFQASLLETLKSNKQ